MPSLSPDRPETAAPRSPSRAERRTGRVVAAAGAVVVALLTLTPSLNAHTLSGFCIFCGDLGVQDFLDNVLLFVPLALGLRLGGLSTWRAIAVALAASTAIELLQRWVIPGRDASVGDVLANTLGGAVGAVLGARWRALVLPRPRGARLLAAVAAAACLAIVAATAWALERSLPRSPRGYDVQWAPEDYPGERFGGRVLAAGSGDVALRPGRVSEGALRPELRRDSVRVDAAFTAVAEQPHGGEVIVRVATPDSAPLLVLGRRGCGLAFEIRLRVHDARMRPPSVEVPDVFPCGAARSSLVGAHVGDTLRVAGVATHSRLHLVVSAGRGVRAGASVSLAPVLGWSFFLPWYPSLRKSAHALGALWLAGLFVPLGYWLARGWERRAERALAAGGALAVVAVALGVVPIASRLAPSVPSDWAAAAAGLAAGWLVGAWSLRGSGASAARRARGGSHAVATRYNFSHPRQPRDRRE